MIYVVTLQAAENSSHMCGFVSFVIICFSSCTVPEHIIYSKQSERFTEQGACARFYRTDARNKKKDTIATIFIVIIVEYSGDVSFCWTRS